MKPRRSRSPANRTQTAAVRFHAHSPRCSLRACRRAGGRTELWCSIYALVAERCLAVYGPLGPRKIAHNVTGSTTIKLKQKTGMAETSRHTPKRFRKGKSLKKCSLAGGSGGYDTEQLKRIVAASGFRKCQLSTCTLILLDIIMYARGQPPLA